ncbi:capsid protein [Lactococcus petauri]|nr:capsid protein [Lactococcus petauri]
MAINYADRKIFWGNELLVTADLIQDDSGKVTAENLKLVTGTVSVGSMEDQAETDNYPADDVPDHGQKKGATLLQGEMVFIQVDQELKEDFLGQKKTANGLGYTPTGKYKSKAVQYLHKGRKKNASTGEIEDGYMITLYPNMTPTAEPTKESETDSVDGVDPITWTFAVQATASEKYLNDGDKVPSVEYEVWGEQAKQFMEKMEQELFLMFPDTVIPGGAPTLVAPEPLSAITSAPDASDGSATIPTKLKDSTGADVTVTNTIKDSTGQSATNGQLKAGNYTVTFKADGYAIVSVSLTVTDPASK